MRSGKKCIIKTWSRACMIAPDFVGHTFGVHNGKQHIPVLLQKIWLGTSSENSHLLADSKLTLVINHKFKEIVSKTKT
jgi:ribosomal protein S19